MYEFFKRQKKLMVAALVAPTLLVDARPQPAPRAGTTTHTILRN